MSTLGTNILTLEELLIIHNSITNELLNTNRLRLKYMHSNQQEYNGVEFYNQEIDKLDKVSLKIAKLIESRKQFKDSA